MQGKPETIQQALEEIDREVHDGRRIESLVDRMKDICYSKRWPKWEWKKYE